MFGFQRRRASLDAIHRLHTAVVAASREPAHYGPDGVPDTVEGRWEALTLHALLVLRRLTALPAPADDVAQEFIDAVFAHLESALRETGVGDFGVPKRMKKLARAFYDRTLHYDPILDSRDADALAAEAAKRMSTESGTVAAPALLRFARFVLASETSLATQDLAAILAAPRFAALPEVAR